MTWAATDCAVRGVVDEHKTVVAEPEIEAGELLHTGAVGHDELTVDVPDLGFELLAATGGVDPHDRRAGQRRAAEPEDEFRGVLEQDPDVKGTRLPQ